MGPDRSPGGCSRRTSIWTTAIRVVVAVTDRVLSGGHLFAFVDDGEELPALLPLGLREVVEGIWLPVEELVAVGVELLHGDHRDEGAEHLVRLALLGEVVLGDLSQHRD